MVSPSTRLQPISNRMRLRIRKFELLDVWSWGTKCRCCCHCGFWLINVKKCLKVRWDRRDWIFHRFAVSLPLTYWSVFFLRSPPRSTVFLALPSQTVTSRSPRAPIADTSQAAQHELNSWPLRLGVMSRASALTPQASGRGGLTRLEPVPTHTVRAFLCNSLAGF